MFLRTATEFNGMWGYKLGGNSIRVECPCGQAVEMSIKPEQTVVCQKCGREYRPKISVLIACDSQKPQALPPWPP